MSLKEIKEFKIFNLFQNNKKIKEAEEYAKKVGFSIIDTPQSNRNLNGFKMVILNTILIFLITFGIAGIFLNAYKLPWNSVIIAVFIMIFSILTSSFYYNRWVKRFGYLISVIFYITGIQKLIIPLRSGFAAITNEFIKVAEDELDLPVKRTFEEYLYNREYAVTICVIFIAFVSILLINVVVSEFKSVFWVLCITFPIVGLCLYFNRDISLFYSSMYIIGVISTLVIRMSGQYSITCKEQFVFNKGKYIHLADDKYNLSLLLSVAIIVVLSTLIMNVIYPPNKFNMGTHYEDLKENTKDFAKKVMLTGFRDMFFSNTEGAGGVGNGQLGTVDYIKLDFQTDLIISTVITEEEESIYLKAFTGTIYEANRWQTVEEYYGENSLLEKYGLNANEAVDITNDFAFLSMRSIFMQNLIKKVQITNVGANEKYLYLPYYTYSPKSVAKHVTSDDELLANAKLINGYYIPISNNIKELKIAVEYIKRLEDSYDWTNLFYREERYRKYVYDLYLQVPEDIKSNLSKLCFDNGLIANSDSIVEDIQNFLSENYTYTLIPKRTPSNKDFVEYFLFENQKGYCSHFATSAVMLLRTLGIPSRFVGGYAIGEEEFTDAAPLYDEEVSNWLNYGVARNDMVESIQVTDANAHAWVEIYIDGFGWYPVEMTPSSDEIQNLADEETGGFIQNIIESFFNREVGNVVKNAAIGVLYVVIMGFVIALIGYLMLFTVVRIKRRKSFVTDNNNVNVINVYNYLEQVLSFAKVPRQKGMCYKEYSKIICKNGYYDEKEMDDLIMLLEKAKYSLHTISREESERFVWDILKLVDGVYIGLGYFDKMIFRFIKLL